MILADYATFIAYSAISDVLWRVCLPLLLRLYPCSSRQPHLVLEGFAESAVTLVATIQGQLQGCYRTLGCNGLTIERGEMIDAQVVDIGIVVRAHRREILAEIETIDAYGFGQLQKGEVVLQVELCVYAIPLKQRPDVGMNSDLFFRELRNW